MVVGVFEFPSRWEIEICERCGQTTRYDRDYGGPFPTAVCPFSDCDVSRDRFYGICPSWRTIVVVEATVGA